MLQKQYYTGITLFNYFKLSSIFFVISLFTISHVSDKMSHPVFLHYTYILCDRSAKDWGDMCVRFAAANQEILSQVGKLYNSLITFPPWLQTVGLSCYPWPSSLRYSRVWLWSYRTLLSLHCFSGRRHSRYRCSVVGPTDWDCSGQGPCWDGPCLTCTSNQRYKGPRTENKTDVTSNIEFVRHYITWLPFTEYIYIYSIHM